MGLVNFDGLPMGYLQVGLLVGFVVIVGYKCQGAKYFDCCPRGANFIPYASRLLEKVCKSTSS